MHTHRKVRRRILGAAAAGLAGAALPFTARAQGFESARIIVGFPPGGTTDVMARKVAEKLRGPFARSVIVENRPGAGGQVGVIALKDAPADGSVMLLTPSSMLTIYPFTYPKLQYRSDDVQPVSLAMYTQHVFSVGPAVPDSVKDLKTFFAWAKANPDKVNYSGAGYGSAGHLAAELLRQRAGIHIVHINYKGGGQAVTDLLGGTIQMLMTGLTTVEGHVKSGKLRPLAFTSSKRISGLPEVPTFAESGYPGLVSYSWYGVLAPMGTPPDVVRRVNAEINKLLQLQDVKDRLAAFGVEPIGGTPEQFARMIREDTVKWAKVVKEAGIQIE